MNDAGPTPRDFCCLWTSRSARAVLWDRRHSRAQGESGSIVGNRRIGGAREIPAAPEGRRLPGLAAARGCGRPQESSPGVVVRFEEEVAQDLAIFHTWQLVPNDHATRTKDSAKRSAAGRADGWVSPGKAMTAEAEKRETLRGRDDPATV